MSRCKACRTPFLTESCSRRRTFASPTRSSSGLTCASPSCCVTCHACVYIHAHLPLYMHTRLIRTCDRTDSFDLTCVLRSCFVTWFICTCKWLMCMCAMFSCTCDSFVWCDFCVAKLLHMCVTWTHVCACCGLWPCNVWRDSRYYSFLCVTRSCLCSGLVFDRSIAAMRVCTYMHINHHICINTYT